MKKIKAILMSAIICGLCCSCNSNTTTAPTTEKEETISVAETTAETTAVTTTAKVTTTTSASSKPVLDKNTNYIQETTLENTTGVSMSDETEVSMNELPNRFYELDGRVSPYKIVIGDHEHDCIDTSDNALMKLGNEKLIDALKVFCVMRGFAPVDNVHTIPAGTLDTDDVYYELSPEFGTYDAIMELADDTFVSNIREWSGYYVTEKPSELLDNNAEPGLTLSDTLESSLKVVDGRTYLTETGYLDGHTLKTNIVGVISSDGSSIEYQLCTICLDESPEALAISEVIPQFYYEHSIMKLVKKDEKWLISQIRFPLGNEEPNNEAFLSNNNVLF